MLLNELPSQKSQLIPGKKKSDIGQKLHSDPLQKAIYISRLQANIIVILMNVPYLWVFNG